VGANGTIFNRSDAMISGTGYGLIAGGNTETINNEGTIKSFSIAAVKFGANSENIILNNKGSVYSFGIGVWAFSNLNGGVIHNIGSLYGFTYGVDVDTNVGLTTTVVNTQSGFIEGGVNGSSDAIITHHGSLDLRG